MPTVLHRLANWASETPSAPAHSFKDLANPSAGWQTLSAKDFCDRVYWLALFLDSKGITPEHAGAILSYNRPEWVQTKLALLLLRAKSAGLYPNSTQKDNRYVLDHLQARVLAVQNETYFNKVGELPTSVEFILVYEGSTKFSPRAVSYSQAIQIGKQLAESGKAKTLEHFLSQIDPKAGAFLIYTSGTTGNPKGALLSHDNLVYTVDVTVKRWDLPPKTETLFSFLPLCHVAETLQCVGVGISLRYHVSFATQFDNVSKELPEVEPTLLLCVPRLWEKMMEGVMAKLEVAPPIKKKLAHWALATGARVAEAKFNGRSAGVFDQVQLTLADRVILSKIRKALGLGKAAKLASGAAPLSAQVTRWFRSIGLEILECYGQTESTGVICLTVPGVDCAGTVGLPAPDMDFKIAEDGEILAKGRHIFVGYFKDEVGTSQTVVNGWLHTGDLGEVTEKGQIRIRGRKKEIMKTSGGKMIAPVPIEERLKEAPMISQVCLVGDNRKYISALITLRDDVPKGAESLAKVQSHVEHLNGQLAGYEQIKRFKVLDREFSIADGEMTPTLKMKRNVIESTYRELIDQMYL